MKTSVAVKTLLGAASLTIPLMAFAESNVQTGAATASPGATAHVDFSIVIPKILYLRVGSGTVYSGATPSYASGGSIDVITFSPTAAQVGSGTAVTGSGGDISGSTETAAIVANSGTVTLNASANAAGLSDGAGDTIAFSEITTAAAAGAFATLLNPPTLTNGVSGNITVPAPASKVIQADAKWTFSYKNDILPPAGTYGAIVANNSRVTYTATMP